MQRIEKMPNYQVASAASVFLLAVYLTDTAGFDSLSNFLLLAGGAAAAGVAVRQRGLLESGWDVARFGYSAYSSVHPLFSKIKSCFQKAPAAEAEAPAPRVHKSE